MKKILTIMAKTILATILVALFSALFVYMQGVQYAIALVTNSWENPLFDSSALSPEKNCDAAQACASGPIGVLTFNVLCRICTKDEEKAKVYEDWYQRLPHLRALVADYQPDLVGFQELGGWKDVNEMNPDPALYEPLGHEFGPWIYADAVLFYRKDRFEALESGQFWLSKKPSLPFSFAWKPLSMPRQLNWAHLRQRDNGFEFLYMNTHFDNNTDNKEPTAVLVNSTFTPHAARLPVVFTGDFNTTHDTQRYRNLLFGLGEENVRDLYNTADLAAQKEEFSITSQAGPDQPGEPLATLDNIIDHVFVAAPGEVKVNRWVVDRRGYGPDSKPPSDHPAVFAEVEFSLRK